MSQDEPDTDVKSAVLTPMEYTRLDRMIDVRTKLKELASQQLRFGYRCLGLLLARHRRLSSLARSNRRSQTGGASLAGRTEDLATRAAGLPR